MFGFRKKDDEINTTVEVASENDVDFEVKKGWVNPITKRIEETRRKKEEEKRRREEEERRKRNQGLAIMVVMLIISLAMIAIPGMTNNNKEVATDLDIENNVSEETDNVGAEPEKKTNIDEAEQNSEELDNDSDSGNTEDTPREFYGDEIPLDSTEDVSFGYIEIRARMSEKYDDSWTFYLLDKSGLRSQWFEIDNLSTDKLPADVANLYDQAAGKYGDKKDYIFTMTGYGRWHPKDYEIEEDDGDFIFTDASVIGVEYDNEDKALIYN